MVYIINRFIKHQIKRNDMKDRKSIPEENQSAMKEKELTPQESMDIITGMIEASRQRVALPDLRLSVI